MNVLFKYNVTILFAVTAMFFTGTVYSAGSELAIKMGMVDMTQVARGSLLAKDIARKINGKRSKFMSEIKTEENSLRKLDGDLQKKQVILSPESFAEERRKFTIKRAALNKMVQSRNQGLLEFRKISDKFWNRAVQTAVSNVVEKNGYNLVFRFTPELVLVRPMAMDISKLVLDQLNKNISTFTLANPPSNTGK